MGFLIVVLSVCAVCGYFASRQIRESKRALIMAELENSDGRGQLFHKWLKQNGLEREYSKMKKGG